MNSEHDNGESELTRRAKELFDASVANIDVATRSKLVRARARALERGGQSRLVASFLGARPWMVGGGALAAAALVAVLVGQGPELPDARVEVAALGDLELLLAEDEFEMLEELEFYAWLEEQPELEVREPADDGVG
jgi:hypothetical protein